MSCISRVREVLEPDIKKQYDGLVNIGIDETCYRKGHNYDTTVVNNDTNAVVWCAPGHSTEVLSQLKSLQKNIERTSNQYLVMVLNGLTSV